MGSATTQALTATTTALQGTGGVDLGVAGELFAAARALGDSSQLSGALADAAAPAAARVKVITDVFGGLSPATVTLLSTAVSQRWSSASDLIDGIEELGIRAAAIAEPGADIEAELFAVSRTVADNSELELALGSRLGQASAKGDLIRSLFDGRASQATTLIASSLVQQPRERRVRRLLSRAMRLVADQRGRAVATVVAAAPLEASQLDRLRTTLAQRYGGQISLNVVVDPDVIGGMRIEIGDDVIDATVAARLHDLRQKLAG